MGMLLSTKTKRIIADVDTGVSMPIEREKDYWSERARNGEAEAYLEWAKCCEKSGEMAEGLIVINEMLRLPLEPLLHAQAILRKAVLQKDHPKLAWSTIIKADLDLPDNWRAQLHNQRGRIKKELREYDKAVEEYDAAVYYWGLHGDLELVGHAYNNLAGVYRKWERYEDAHESVDRAIRLWWNYEYLPHALDQKALIFVDEEEYAAALPLVLQAERGAGDRRRWRAEFLCTLSKVRAGLGEFIESLLNLERALEIADYLQDENLRLIILVARKGAVEIMREVADRHVTVLALHLSGGKIRQAAQKVDRRHAALTKSVKKHKLHAVKK